MECIVNSEQETDAAESYQTEEIWREFHHRLKGFIQSRTSNNIDAEDILQDVFTRIHINRQKLSTLQSVSGWVFRITRNALADYYRSHATSFNAMQKLSSNVKGDNEVASNLAASALEDVSLPDEKLVQCMKPFAEHLPEPYREAIELTELGGLSQRQAALQLGISVSGMKSRIQRGRDKLKSMLLDCCSIELDRRKKVIDVKPCENTDSEDCDCS